MRDIPRITFLIIIDAFVVALLITMLSACVTTPTNYRDRTGDFVSNIASTEAASTMASRPLQVHALRTLTEPTNVS